MAFDPGNTIRLRVSFTDPDTGAPFDPSTVVFEVLRPGDTVAQTPAFVKDGTGQYHADQYVAFGFPGTWVWRVTATGPAVGAERQFSVNASRFTS